MSLSKGLLGVFAACLVASCATGEAYTGADTGARRGYAELGGGRRPAPPSSARPSHGSATGGGGASIPPSSRLSSAERPSAIVREDQLYPMVLQAAEQRIDRFLRDEGFQAEPAGPGSVTTARIMATRMTTEGPSPELAYCALHALARPQMYAASVDVRLSPQAPPSGSAIRVAVDVRFTVMDMGVVSGVLTKHACRSRGVLEEAVRRAGLGDAAVGGAAIGPPQFSGG